MSDQPNHEEQVYTEQPAQPPQPPQVPRRFKQYLFQWIGVPIFVLVALLAVFGVFGETVATAEESSAALELEVEYPSRFRYRTDNLITVSVTNRTDQALDSISVRFDQSYVSNFANVTFQPSVETIADNTYVVALTDVAPGETRSVVVEVQAESYWRHEGTISASAGEDSVSVSVATFVFP